MQWLKRTAKILLVLIAMQLCQLVKIFQLVLDVIFPGPSQNNVITSCVDAMLKNYNGFIEMRKSYTKMWETLSLCLKASKHSSIEMSYKIIEVKELYCQSD